MSYMPSEPFVFCRQEGGGGGVLHCLVSIRPFLILYCHISQYSLCDESQPGVQNQNICTMAEMPKATLPPTRSTHIPIYGHRK